MGVAEAGNVLGVFIRHEYFEHLHFTALILTKMDL
jgi:hypothetical protein